MSRFTPQARDGTRPPSWPLLFGRVRQVRRVGTQRWPAKVIVLDADEAGFLDRPQPMGWLVPRLRATRPCIHRYPTGRLKGRQGAALRDGPEGRQRPLRPHESARSGSRYPPPACVLSVGHRFLLPRVRDATIAEPSGFSKACAGAPPGHLRQGVTSTHWRLITKDIATPTETDAVTQGSAASGSLMLPPSTCWHEGRPGVGRRRQAGLALSSSRDICRRRRRRRCIRGVALAVGRRLLRDLEPGRLACGCWLCPPGVRQGINEQEAAATLVVGPSVDSARQ